jgi:putative hydrolase of the HAD superfamily
MTAQRSDELMIKNVIFDVGNVFVRWSPPDIVHRCFDLAPDSDENLQRAEVLFRGQTWRNLNLGALTQAEAELVYQAQLGLTAEQTGKLFFHVMDHQEQIDGTAAIAQRLKQAGTRVFGLTDNVREIVRHLKSRYQLGLVRRRRGLGGDRNDEARSRDLSTRAADVRPHG